MRKILCLHLKTGTFPSEILDYLCAYTPLLEPIAEDTIFLDLSAYRHIADILKEISHTICNECGQQIIMGLSNSRLLSYTAVFRTSLPDSVKQPKSYHLINTPELCVIQVLPGQESTFIASVPLQEFLSIQHKEVRLLSRLGFSTVGEIASLPDRKLSELIKRDATLLSLHSRGIDPIPVMGLYPPFRIICPAVFEEGTTDSIVIEKALDQTTLTLQKILENRHAGCREIRLELFTQEEQIQQERITTSPCYTSESLGHILKALLQQMNLQSPLLEYRVNLGKLSPLQMLEQDLFSNRISYDHQQRQMNLENMLTNLEQRFPDRILHGIEVDRREQLLSLWDPWRYPGKEQCIHENP